MGEDIRGDVLVLRRNQVGLCNVDHDKEAMPVERNYHEEARLVLDRWHKYRLFE